MATWKSNSFEGRYLELKITESVDTANNKSTLYWTLASVGGESEYYAVAETTVTINGQQVYHKAKTDWSAKVFPVAEGSTSGSVTVAHNSDGSKSINIGFSTRVYYSSAEEYGGTMTLTKIDRTAPTVSFGVTNITANGFKISASSSVIASKWWYSLDGGTSWTEFGSEGTSKAVTVTGLTPNTSYNIQVCARKKSNLVDGYSTKASYKTLGGTVINSASAVTADSDTVKVTMGLTVYDSSFYHKLTIKNGSNTILTTAAIKFSSSGKSNRTITLTAAQRTTLLNAMANVKSFTATLLLVTYKESGCTTQIGSASVKTCAIKTTESISKPTFTDFSYVDSRGLVGKLTGSTNDNVILIQSYSNLIVNAVAGTAKNGATIKSYSASIGSASKTSGTTAINVGMIGSYGDSMVLTVSCIDSRGYATRVTKHVKVLKYQKPKLYSVTLRRKDEIEDIIQLSFRGAISSLKPEGTAEKNSLKTVGFYYKKTTESKWSSLVSIKNDVSESGTSFTFSTEQLMLSSTKALSLDTELSYDFHLLIRDKLDSYASYDAYFTIPQGKPLVSLRKRDSTYNFPRIGVNNPNPTEALDVAGNIKCLSAYFSKSIYADRFVYMGGYKKSDTEKDIYFQTTDGAANPHNTAIYGGNGESTAAWGVYDAKNSRSVIRYDDEAGTLRLLGFTPAGITVSASGSYLKNFSGTAKHISALSMGILRVSGETNVAMPAGTTYDVASIGDHLPTSTYALSVYSLKNMDVRLSTSGTIQIRPKEDIPAGYDIYIAGIWIAS